MQRNYSVATTKSLILTEVFSLLPNMALLRHMTVNKSYAYSLIAALTVKLFNKIIDPRVAFKIEASK